MDFSLTDSIAYLTNINTETFVDDFNAIKAQIPDNVTIQFEPSQPDSMLDGLNTGRQMYVNMVQRYDPQYIGAATLTIIPTISYYQQLLPLSS